MASEPSEQARGANLLEDFPMAKAAQQLNNKHGSRSVDPLPEGKPEDVTGGGKEGQHMTDSSQQELKHEKTQRKWDVDVSR